MFVNRMITFFTSRYRPQFWSGILLVFYYASHYKRPSFLGGGRRVVHWIVTDFSCRRDDPRPAQDARSRSSATHGGQRENSFIKLTDTMSLTEPVRDTELNVRRLPSLNNSHFDYSLNTHARITTHHRTGPHSTHSVCSRLADRHFISNILDLNKNIFIYKYATKSENLYCIN